MSLHKSTSIASPNGIARSPLFLPMAMSMSIHEFQTSLYSCLQLKGFQNNYC